MVANTRPEHTRDTSINLPMGWTLKASAVRKRFTPSQKDYLTAKFKLGEQSGQKADPASVARAMVSAKDTSGKRLFKSDDFLTAQQIAGFFSRLSAKKTLQDDEEQSDDDFESAVHEAEMDELRNMALHELAPRHPVTFDAYNLCDMAAKSKLKNFSVPVLREICLFFGIDIAGITMYRKQPYVSKIESLCLSCTCHQ